VCQQKYLYSGLEAFIQEGDSEEDEDEEEEEESNEDQINNTESILENQSSINTATEEKLTMVDLLLESKDIETQHLFLQRFKNLKDRFGDFIRAFEENERGNVVTKRDIDTFFESITKETEEENDFKRRKMYY